MGWREAGAPLKWDPSDLATRPAGAMLPSIMLRRPLLVILPALAALAPAARGDELPAPPKPNTVCVVYNEAIPQSKELAASYAAGRLIPEENLIGLNLPEAEQITREQYDALVRLPLVSEFDRRDWWTRARNAEGNLEPRETRIRIIACMRGVPSRITEPAPEPPADGSKPPAPGQEAMMKTTKASVDSELAMLGIENAPLAGPLGNPYFEQDRPFAEAGLPVFLVGRIDAHSWPVCQRMIRDALHAEETGLWGNAVVDIANKHPQGDTWLGKVAAQLRVAGIPTLVDRFNPTLPTNYPLRDTAIYYGWYDWNVSGPFRNPDFRLRRGAVAVHLHSFSATQLRNVNNNWCAPLLARGAAATVGNVHEPFLHLTHHLDILNQRLLDGYTLVEAASMAMPAVSWQGVVIGDPLYRPFLHLDGTGRKVSEDRTYRALRIAAMRWGATPDEQEKQLRNAARRMKNGEFLEALGHEFAAREEPTRAAGAYREARELYTDGLDRLRIDLLLAGLDRAAGRKIAAIKLLRDARSRYSHLPEAKAAAAWLTILDPPPPPPAGTEK